MKVFIQSTLVKLRAIEEHRIYFKTVQDLVTMTDFGPIQELIDQGYLEVAHINKTTGVMRVTFVASLPNREALDALVDTLIELTVNAG